MLQMNNERCRAVLSNAFKTHMFMSDRDIHTVNELLYILGHHDEFKLKDFSISIKRLDERWLNIPTIDAFVNVGTRGLWFKDSEVEFEVEECGEEKFNCITIYECEKGIIGYEI